MRDSAVSVRRTKQKTLSALISAKAFLQCLYSQCQTAQYGLALHHAISTCSKYGSNVVPMLPTLIRHRNRRTPDVETVPNHPSSSASHLPIRSAIRSIPVQTASILFMRKPRATGTPSLVTHSMPVQTASNLFMRKPCATGTPGSAAHLIPVQTASIPFMRRPRATGTSLDHSLDFSTNR